MGRKQILVVGSGSSGTVTSVAETFTGGLISVAGSPVTTSGTLALTVAGTSGGVPYFSSSSAWASSAALASGQFVLGGGAGNPPTTSFSVVPVANGGVPALSTAAQGYFWGVAGIMDSAVGGTATIVSPTGANNVLVWMFVLPMGITVRKVVFRNGTTVTASATASFGIYDISGNLLLDSGTFSTAVASQTLSNTLGASVALNPGIYWFAQACTNNTNDASGNITNNNNAWTYRNANTVRQGTAANAYAAGALPATLGVVTGFANRTPVPILFES